MLDKHSIDLHAAASLSSGFNEWAAKLPTALPRIFENRLLMRSYCRLDLAPYRQIRACL